MSDELHDGESIPKEEGNGDFCEANPKNEHTKAPIPISPAKPNIPPAESHNGCKQYKRIKEEIKFWFELAGIIAGVAVLLVLIGQYDDMTKWSEPPMSP